MTEWRPPPQPMAPKRGGGRAFKRFAPYWLRHGNRRRSTRRLTDNKASGARSDDQTDDVGRCPRVG
jgi:hypothetical protein